ncbi:MAG: S24 family peptidase [Candidatus Pedobacter colombiensis]|uniref:S24 family peptidase n=1 Tax=Candidatus Pedobacter colombiensis TaxID=3121371 RepID=A0AAJ5W6T5_9SPHI|nr:S24 family peptidase [Pedobacter sp.]WEK18193.1 MAG: S24 family peptidase [Pedobacter sp.]
MEITKKINEIAIEFFDNNNSKFAAEMNTSETNIRNYRNKIIPKVEFIIKLCNMLEINFDWMFNNEGAMKRSESSPGVSTTNEFVLRTDRRQETQQVPLYDANAAASLIKLFDSRENVIDYITIPNLPKSDGALYIKGDSMYPLLKSGDIAIYKRVSSLEDGIYYGEMYLLSIDIDGDDATVVKYVQKSEKGDQYIRLVSYNAHHAPKDLHLKHVKAMALIKASIRINTMM